jgi:peptidoglycan/LPS O-acetylase OafA/YrhL
MDPAVTLDLANHQPPPNRLTRLRNIDLIRCVAASVVFLSHISPYLSIARVDPDHITKQHSLLTSLSELAFCGPAAVMLFFIVSGICIHAPHLAAGQIRLREYYLRRYIRIGLPVLAAYIVLIGLAGSANIQLLPLWSLICEAVYYLLYPLLVRVMRQVGFLPVFAVALAASLGLGLVPDHNDGQISTYGPFLSWILYLPVWLMGVWIAERPDMAKAWPDFVRTGWFSILAACGALGLGTLAVVAQFHLAGGPHFKTSMVLLGFPYALLIALLLCVDTSGSRVCRFLDRQGAWSYSLYLMHPIAALVCLRVLVASGAQSFGHAESLAIYAALLVFGFGLARLFYLLVERPSHHLARRLSARTLGAPAFSVQFQGLT